MMGRRLELRCSECNTEPERMVILCVAENDTLVAKWHCRACGAHTEAYISLAEMFEVSTNLRKDEGKGNGGDA